MIVKRGSILIQANEDILLQYFHLKCYNGTTIPDQIQILKWAKRCIDKQLKKLEKAC
jgi:hypothetical protein